jgi:UDP-N-acetyl-D-mannosaminuronic acid dehydrogenase
MSLGCQLLIVEPNIHELPNSMKKTNVNLIELDDAIASSDIVCVLVKHSPFLEKKNSMSARNNVIDAVGVFS